MSIFSAIMGKIFHADMANPVAAAQPVNEAAPNPATTVPAPVSAPAQGVYVGAVLSQMADQKGGGGNYQKSIVDLLKLVDLDSSLDVRKQLVTELNVHIGADGSAEENLALHKAVMQKLAANGGKVPESMKA